MSRKHICWLLLSIALPPSGMLTADEPLPADPAHAQLVRQLGAAEYRTRERAARELRETGIAAKAALLQGLRAEDLEIRMGAHRLLVQILQNDFQQRIDAFVNGKSDGERDLPGWRSLRNDLGDTPSSRRLYADMLRNENELIVAIGNRDASLDELVDERVQFLLRSNTMLSHETNTLKGPTLATILFAVGQLHEMTRGEDAPATLQRFNPSIQRVCQLLSYRVSLESMQNVAHAHEIQQLLTNWVKVLGETNDRYSRSYALNLSLRFELRAQGPAVARKVLTDPSALGSAVPYAAIVLARFGALEDVKYLEPHLKNKQVFHTWSNRALKKEPIRIQVRDAVLAMMMLLHGQDPAKHGFRLLKKDESTIYKVYTLGFLEDADRDATFNKWQAFTEAMSEKEPSPPAEALQERPDASDS